MHQEYLIQLGEKEMQQKVDKQERRGLQRRAYIRDRARRLAVDVCKVWKDLGVPHTGFKAIHTKTTKLLEKRRIKRRPGGPILPDGDKMFDIAICRCFQGICPERMSLNQCPCKTPDKKRNPI